MIAAHANVKITMQMLMVTRRNETMNRYFYFPDAKITLCVGVKPGTAAALATPEQIRDHFRQKGAVREIESTEYTRLTDIYTWNARKEQP